MTHFLNYARALVQHAAPRAGRKALGCPEDPYAARETLYVDLPLLPRVDSFEGLFQTASQSPWIAQYGYLSHLICLIGERRRIHPEVHV